VCSAQYGCFLQFLDFFSASFLITFLSPQIAISINIHVSFSLSRIMMSGLLLGIVLSVCTCWFHSMITLPPWLVCTDFGTCSYQCLLSNCICFLAYVSVAVHSLYHVFLSTVLLPVIIIIVIIIIIIISFMQGIFILIFLRQTMSLGNRVLQLFCCYYSRCLHR